MVGGRPRSRTWNTSASKQPLPTSLVPRFTTTASGTQELKFHAEPGTELRARVHTSGIRVSPPQQLSTRPYPDHATTCASAPSASATWMAAAR